MVLPVAAAAITAIGLWRMAGVDRPATDYARIEDAAYIRTALDERALLLGLRAAPPDMDSGWTNRIIHPFLDIIPERDFRDLTNAYIRPPLYDGANTHFSGIRWAVPDILGPFSALVAEDHETATNVFPGMIGAITNLYIPPPVPPYAGPTTGLLHYAATLLPRLAYTVGDLCEVTADLREEWSDGAETTTNGVADYSTVFARMAANRTNIVRDAAGTGRWFMEYGQYENSRVDDYTTASAGYYYRWPTSNARVTLPHLSPRLYAHGAANRVVKSARLFVEDTITLRFSGPGRSTTIGWASGHDVPRGLGTPGLYVYDEDSADVITHTRRVRSQSIAIIANSDPPAFSLPVPSLPTPPAGPGPYPSGDYPASGGFSVVWEVRIVGILLELDSEAYPPPGPPLPPDAQLLYYDPRIP